MYETLVGLRGNAQRFRGGGGGQGTRQELGFLLLLVVWFFSFCHLFNPSFCKEHGGALKTKGRNPWGGRTHPSPVTNEQAGSEPSAVQVHLLQPQQQLHWVDESPVLQCLCSPSQPWLLWPAALPCSVNSPKLPWSALPWGNGL